MASIYRVRKNYAGEREQNRPLIHASGERPLRTTVVLGSGGHTTEMLNIVQHLSRDVYYPLSYIVASSDSTSMQRFENPPKGISSEKIKPNKVNAIPRSREVGQSYFTSIFTTLWATVSVFSVVFSTRPDVLLCNGPGTCIPVAVSVFLCRIIGLSQGKIIFIESFCRVKRYSNENLKIVTSIVLIFSYCRIHICWTL